MSKSLIFELIKILENSKFRFSNYQDLPGFIFEKIPELKKIKYKKNQLNLDNARYSWLKGLVDSEIQRVSEIGSNIGFFSFNMTNDFGVNYESYEVNKDYSEVNKKLSRLLKLNHLLKAYTISMNLKSLLDMKEHDLHINLNVLHHAGTAFDKDLINSQSDWFEYSKNYLGNLSKKGKYLFFQTGNMMNGSSIFDSKETIPFIRSLLMESGWKILKIGIIEDLNKLTYKSYDESEIKKIKVFNCSRNKKTNLVDYFLDGVLVSSLLTGLAQRPLWFCKKKDAQR